MNLVMDEGDSLAFFTGRGRDKAQ